MTDLPRIEVIAKLVGPDEDVTATPREREIAEKLKRLGARMEKAGYLPALRRKRMLDTMMAEARRP